MQRIGTAGSGGTFVSMLQRPNASVVFVLVTLGLDALGVGIIAPIVPGLVQQLSHLSPQQAAPWVGALIASYAAMQFFAAPVLAELSDRFGRRPVILLSVAGMGCDYILLALAPDLWWLFIGRLVAGATSANVAAATAYIADVSDLKDRARLFGLVGATFGGGFVLGPVLGGLASEWGLRVPFYIAAGLSLLNVCFGLFVLPESLKPENRRAPNWLRANPFSVLSGIAADRALKRLAIAWSCTWIGLGAVQSSLVLFTSFRFGWGPGLSGLTLAGIGLSQAMVEGVLLKYITSWIGERRTGMFGYLAGAAGYALVALASAGWTMIPAVMLMALGGLATPSVRALVAGRGGDDTHGKMQGILTAIEGLTAIVAPLVTAGLFFLFTAKIFPIAFPGAPFALAAVSGLVGWRLLQTFEGATTEIRLGTPS